MAKAKEKLDVTCPRCGHTWSPDLAELSVAEVNYRERGRMSQYRLQCPECGGRWRMTVAEEVKEVTEEEE